MNAPGLMSVKHPEVKGVASGGGVRSLAVFTCVRRFLANGGVPCQWGRVEAELALESAFPFFAPLDWHLLIRSIHPELSPVFTYEVWFWRQK